MTESEKLQLLNESKQEEELTTDDVVNLTRLIKHIGEDTITDIDFDMLAEIISEDLEVVEYTLILAQDLGLFEVSFEDGIIINE